MKINFHSGCLHICLPKWMNFISTDISWFIHCVRRSFCSVISINRISVKYVLFLLTIWTKPASRLHKSFCYLCRFDRSHILPFGALMLASSPLLCFASTTATIRLYRSWEIFKISIFVVILYEAFEWINIVFSVCFSSTLSCFFFSLFCLFVGFLSFQMNVGMFVEMGQKHVWAKVILTIINELLKPNLNQNAQVAKECPADTSVAMDTSSRKVPKIIVWCPFSQYDCVHSLTYIYGLSCARPSNVHVQHNIDIGLWAFDLSLTHSLAIRVNSQMESNQRNKRDDMK